MNFGEGTRRLALLLGVAGAILGGVASYVELQSVLNQRARHNRFEQLAASDVVKRERKIIEAMPPLADPTDDLETQNKQSPDESQPIGPSPSQDNAAKTSTQKTLSQSASSPINEAKGTGGFPLRSYQGIKDRIDNEIKMTQDDIKTRRMRDDLMEEGGIRTIHWTKHLEVNSIETLDGQTLNPTPSPSAWLYLLIALFPMLGFLIPWGVIRAIGWVGAGFFANSK